MLHELLKEHEITFYRVIEEMGLGDKASKNNWYDKFYGDRHVKPEELDLLLATLKKLMPEVPAYKIENCVTPSSYKII